METWVPIMAVNLAAVLALMAAGWVASLPARNVTVVDSLWGVGFVLIAWITYGLADGAAARGLLVATLATLWGLRLAAYLSWRNFGRGEDPRYGTWRAASGGRFWIVSLFKVFLLQALFLWAISIVLQVSLIAARPPELTVWDGIGALVWAVGFVLESVADLQLARFRARPQNRGRVMDRGLWRFSRHPNYFGECLVWWGFYLIALAVPGGWATLFSPVLITLVLLKMTGIPLTESTLVARRPAYRDYQRRTSAFIPWPPKGGAS